MTVYIEGDLDMATLDMELESLFETAPEFEGLDWITPYNQLEIEPYGSGFDVTTRDPNIEMLLLEFLELIADEYNGTAYED